MTGRKEESKDVLRYRSPYSHQHSIPFLILGMLIPKHFSKV